MDKAYLCDSRVTNIYKSFTHKMAAKTSCHRYGTKLRHCHPMYSERIIPHRRAWLPRRNHWQTADSKIRARTIVYLPLFPSEPRTLRYCYPRHNTTRCNNNDNNNHDNVYGRPTIIMIKVTATVHPVWFESGSSHTRPLRPVANYCNGLSAYRPPSAFKT